MNKTIEELEAEWRNAGLAAWLVIPFGTHQLASAGLDTFGIMPRLKAWSAADGKEFMNRIQGEIVQHLSEHAQEINDL